MLTNHITISVLDVFQYHQKKEKANVSARSFSSISLKYHTGGKYICKGQSHPFTPVSVCIIPEGIPYIRHSNEEDIFVIHFQMINHVFDNIHIYNVTDGEKYKKLFLDAFQLKQENTPSATYKIAAIVYEIFAELSLDVGFSPNRSNNRIRESADYMKLHFADPQLSIEEVARKFSISPAYYRREFRKEYGTSPKEYLDTLRFQYAKFLLETGYFSQKEIASRCGYSDVVYFRNVFKKKSGKCIREYIKKL